MFQLCSTVSICKLKIVSYLRSALSTLIHDISKTSLRPLWAKLNESPTQFECSKKFQSCLVPLQYGATKLFRNCNFLQICNREKKKHAAPIHRCLLVLLRQTATNIKCFFKSELNFIYWHVFHFKRGTISKMIFTIALFSSSF